MLTLVLALACAHRVSWEVQPAPAYTLASMEVAVVAGDRSCKRVADELAEALSARGVTVRPDAAQRLEVRKCDELLHTNIEVLSMDYGLAYAQGVRTERRRYTMRGTAHAELWVGDRTKLLGAADRNLRGPWVTEGDLDLPGALALREGLQRDLARDLAQQVAPLPETISRRLYRDPEPGTARQLHNEAVEAERGGDLDRAVALAREAYAADPSMTSLRYLEELKAHAEAVGYALKEP
ncbi:MAG: hypothetical protein ACOZNI_03710 [Myxococcota bacterium]